MITKEQALTEDQFHFGDCKRIVGPRGGTREFTEHWRRNGATKTWVTRPEQFSVPVKYGQFSRRGYGYIDQNNAHQFHTPGDCPLNRPK